MRNQLTCLVMDVQLQIHQPTHRSCSRNLSLTLANNHVVRDRETTITIFKILHKELSEYPGKYTNCINIHSQAHISMNTHNAKVTSYSFYKLYTSTFYIQTNHSIKSILLISTQVRLHIHNNKSIYKMYKNYFVLL